MTESPDTRLSQFDWVKGAELTSGGQGAIFPVTSKGLSGQFIMKVLKDRRRIARFRREITAMVELRKRGCRVVAIIDYQYSPDPKTPCFYIMPFYPLGTLGDAIEKTSGMPLYNDVHKALTLFYELACELQRIHNLGTFHRDLKPSNILVAEDGSFDFCDFGLCFLPESAEDRQTEPLEQLGSRYYIAPEALEGRINDVDEKCDIYSMGKICFIMIYGAMLQNFTIHNIDEMHRPQHPHNETIRRYVRSLVDMNPDNRMRAWSRTFSLIRDIVYPVQEMGSVILPTQAVPIDEKRVLELVDIENQAKERKQKLAAYVSELKKLRAVTIGYSRQSEEWKNVWEFGNDIGWGMHSGGLLYPAQLHIGDAHIPWHTFWEDDTSWTFYDEGHRASRKHACIFLAVTDPTGGKRPDYNEVVVVAGCFMHEGIQANQPAIPIPHVTNEQSRVITSYINDPSLDLLCVQALKELLPLWRDLSRSIP